jgi:hypothetical protein
VRGLVVLAVVVAALVVARQWPVAWMACAAVVGVGVLALSRQRKDAVGP